MTFLVYKHPAGKDVARQEVVWNEWIRDGFLWRDQNQLVRSLRAGNAFVDGLAAGESFVRAVPMSDGGFAHLPAEQDDAALDFAGKIEQSDIEIFNLHRAVATTST
jgi:hypothetical protein